MKTEIFTLFTIVPAVLALLEIESMSEYKHEVLKAKQPVVLFAYSDYCRRCEVMMKDINFAEELYPHITFARVDVDKVMGITSELMAISLPTFAYFENGKKLRKRSGPMTGYGLRKFIEQ